jgi:phospholipid/cholesterol/gamma-HCH transport system substrate-binding protein
MKFHLSTEFKVGLLITGGLILLIVGLILGQSYRIASGKKDISLLFPNSGGIKISEPVVINGVNQGNVKSIKNFRDSVLIIASVNKDLDIRSDASARITILELTGGKKIELYTGASSELYNPKDFIRGNTPPDLQELIATLGSASVNLSEILKNLDNTLASANKILSNDTLITNFEEIIDNTNKTVHQLNSLLNKNYANLDETIKDLHSISNNLDNMIKSNQPQVNSISQNLDTILRDSKPILAKANLLFDSLNIVMSNLQKISKELESGNGIVPRLINDKNLSARLDSTLFQLDTLLNQIIRYGINTNIRLGTKP